MATMRRRNLVSSRRRVEDEGEEDDGPLGAGDDSASEASVLTDVDDNLEIDDSDLSENGDTSSVAIRQQQAAIDLPEEGIATKDEATTSTVSESRRQPSEKFSGSVFINTADTDAMMHGLKPEENLNVGEEITFEDAISAPVPKPSVSEAPRLQKDAGTTKRESMVQRRIRESQEYNSKRESDPAFVPTRGGFFMHDHRNDTLGPSHSIPFGRGRGRGTEIMANANPLLRSNNPPGDASKARWDHDLHDAITNTKPTTEPKAPIKQETKPERHHQPENIARTVTLSRSIPVGAVMVKVSLPSTEKPVKALKMTVNQHTKLPDLRPPLRRDKPVRVSIPDSGPHYIFPSTERSFVFIPRAQRPNQQASKSMSRSFGNQSGSRRTSAYGDSGYEPSTSMSRRSSVVRDGFVSLQNPVVARQPPGGATGPARPVVKLPSGPTQDLAATTNATSANSTSPNQPYDLPSQPTYRENSTSQLTMHQPRPQKAVSVATIESPSNAPLHAPQQQVLQPFHYQVPTHINGQVSSELLGTMMGPPLSVGVHAARSTSTSNIPEGAINAQPFQPSTLTPQAAYASSYPTQPMYYYPTQPDAQSDPYPVDHGASPVFVQQGPYLVPMFIPPAGSGDETAAATQMGTFAQERNGMVYYYDSSQLMGGSDEVAPVAYTVPGTSTMLPPGQDGYYYAHTPTNVVYYPS